MNKPQLLSMKQHGAALKLTISIEDICSSDWTLSEEYNIYNCVVVRFQSYQESRGQMFKHCNIAIKIHELAKDLRISIQVSRQSKEKAEIFASDDYSDWKQIYFGNNEIIAVDLTVTVIKVQSINRKLCADDTFTDFQLSAEDGSVPVLRAFLAAHSDMFKTMLNGQWKETAEGRVELKGVYRQTLQHFKEYMYLGALPDGIDTLCPLLLIAKRYLIDTLKLECVMKLMQTITAENFYTLHDFALENEILDLLHSILQKTPENILPLVLI